ncbi:MAG: virulence-associated E family protein [Pseudomonadota bacterium]
MTVISLRKRWLGNLQTDDRGRALANLANAMLFLREDPALSNAFYFDEMAQLPVLQRSILGVDVSQPRPLSDVDVSAAQEFTQLAGLPRMNRETLYQAIELRAHERSFHPVRDYLDGLNWDGIPRVDSWLFRYLGAEHDTYTARIGQMFLVQLVARVFEPGCKADYMQILERPQGCRKSTACAILGGDWFSDSLPDLSAGKDVSQHLRGKWLIEIAELSAMSKAESAALKAFITRPVERYRPSYGRQEVVQPRQCAFIGTTNQQVYLRGETGGRRFWPARVGSVDSESLARDRDQLFAEAVKLYRDGGRWWPDAQFERDYIREQQDARRQQDPWAEAIGSWLKSDNPVRPSTLEIARGALGFEAARLGTTDNNRIAAVMQSLGYTPAKSGGKRFWRHAE